MGNGCDQTRRVTGADRDRLCHQRWTCLCFRVARRYRFRNGQTLDFQMSHGGGYSNDVTKRLFQRFQLKNRFQASCLITIMPRSAAFLTSRRKSCLFFHSSAEKSTVGMALTQLFNLLWPLKGVASALALLSLGVTYLIRQASTNFPPPIHSVSHTRYRGYYRKRIRDLAHEEQALDEERRRIVQSAPFKFTELPSELAISILSHCAYWPETYSAVLRTSSSCHRLALTACIPLMPIRLSTPEQFNSFRKLLRKRQRVDHLVQHLWLTPLTDDLVPIAAQVLKQCVNIRSLAANMHLIQQSFALDKGRLSHPRCRDFTLLSTGLNWTTLLSTPVGAALFQQITHLRLLRDNIPREMPFPNLTHLSYLSVELLVEKRALEMLDDRQAFPSLHTIIVTNMRNRTGGVRMSRAASRRVFMLDVPEPTESELTIWRENVYKTGFWDLCT